jgi:hypothetical protein
MAAKSSVAKIRRFVLWPRQATRLNSPKSYVREQLFRRGEL